MDSEDPMKSYLYQHLASRYKRAKEEKARIAEDSPYPADIPRVQQITSSVATTEGSNTKEEAIVAEESPYPAYIPKVEQASSSVAATEGSDTREEASTNDKRNNDQTIKKATAIKDRNNPSKTDIQNDNTEGQALRIVVYPRGTTGRSDMIPAVIKQKNRDVTTDK